MLARYLAQGDEAVLRQAYELGRRALAEGGGMLEMIEIHHKALAAMLQRQPKPEDSVRTVAASVSLLSESLVPFEITYRGFRESMRKLSQLSETLEQQVMDRTAELQQMKEKYYGIFENAIEGIFQSTPGGRFLTANPALAHKFGFQTSHELTETVTDIARQLYVDPGRRQDFIRLMEARGYVWGFESRVHRKDGSVIWISENARTVRDASGTQYYQGFVIDITDRKRSEETRARLAAIVESSSDAIVSKTLDGIVMSWNRGAERLFGYTAEEIVGQPVSLLFPPDHIDEEAAIIERLKRGERLEHYETVRRRKDGRDIDVSLTISPIKDETGRIIGASKIARDITERKQAEQLLQTRARQQAVVAELGQQALADDNLTSVMAHTARRVAQTLGVELSHILELLPDGASFLVRTGFGWREGAVGQTIPPPDGETQASYTLRSGGAVIVDDMRTDTRFQALPLLLEHGVVSGLSVIIHGQQDQAFGVLAAYTTQGRTFTQDDVNFVQAAAHILAMAIQRKRTEQALRRSEERYHSLVDGIQDYAVFMLDAEGRVASWNTGAERATGYRTEEITGEPLACFYPREDVERGTPQISLNAAAAEGRHEEEGWRVRKDGSRFWANVVLAALRGDEGVLRGFSMVMRDVTERELAGQQLRESREQLHALSSHLLSVREEERAAVAREIHDEFGQALTGLKMDLAWLSARLPAGQQAALDKAKDMSKLIDATVQSVRRIAMKLRPSLLDDLGILAALEWYAHDFQGRTGIQCKFTSRVRDLDLDRERATTVFRIFQESLTNVARHASATRVTAKLNVVGGDVVLEVKDNGRGITDRELANAKSFGLLGMRERAYLAGGEVHIKGLPGKGTTISVRIPVSSGTEV